MPAPSARPPADLRDDRAGVRTLTHVALAVVSGTPALVYQVVWTRSVALLIGSQIEAIAVVLVTFFGGLALGARCFGRAADRTQRPLRLYAWLELIAGTAAIGSVPLFGLAGDHLLGRIGPAATAVVVGLWMLGVTFLLGGTLPALIRSALRDPSAAPRTAGLLVGVNTAGAVLGVVAAIALIPSIGLARTTWTAGGLALLLGVLALGLGRIVGPPPHPTRPPVAGGASRPTKPEKPRRTLWAAWAYAGIGGVATLSFEVLAARTASLALGSSLLAWGLVLTLFLIGLAAGNLLLARRAARTRTAQRDLGVIETLAAVILAAGIVWTVPGMTVGATGLAGHAPLAIALWVVPTTLLMGAAFPLFVRLGAGAPEEIGAAFGAVSAANTVGGIAGALVGPFVLLPLLGLRGGLLACSAINAALAVWLLLGTGGDGRRRLAHAGVAVALVAAAWGAPRLIRISFTAPGATLIHVSHGRQATAVVVRVAGRRDLIVDGDREASTGGTARATEEMLAVLPLLLHPEPLTLLEVGLGSGITLGTTTRFPLDRIDCVEIADAVRDCTPYFAPQNHGVASGDDARVRIHHGDGRAYLAAHPDEYDVVLANTLHPWSVRATGLYSTEYFRRIRNALRPGGIAAQWLPLDHLGAENLRTILRTFFGVFPDGDVWWGAGNIIIVGRKPPYADVDAATLSARRVAAAERLDPLGFEAAATLNSRRLATAAETLTAVGAGPVLTDDRPRLEASAVLRSRDLRPAEELEVVLEVARAGTASAAFRTWLESRVARGRGDDDAADEMETSAIADGLTLARRDRAGRRAMAGRRALADGRATEAERLFRDALADEPSNADARLGLAVVFFQRSVRDPAVRELERLVASHPDHSEGWNLLGVLRQSGGDEPGAIDAFDRALWADPFSPDALANAGLLAVLRGETTLAEEMLRRLDAFARDTTKARALRERLSTTTPGRPSPR